MRGVTQCRVPFLGICEQVPVRIGNFRYEVPFFVTPRSAQHRIILGRPFQHQAAANQHTNVDSSVDLILWNQERTERTKIPAFSMNHPRNKTREQVMNVGRPMDEIEDEESGN